jgi:hypothetical protein
VASVAISGDASLASTGSLTISTGAVTSAKILDGTIATSDIAASAITSVTIADSNITNSKLDKSNIPLSGFGAASANVALGDNQITGVATPTTSDAAATKGYVDSQNATDNTLNQGSVIVGDASNEKAALDAKTSGAILVGDGTTVASVAISGDASLASTGSLTISTGAVTSAKILDGTIATSDIAASAITSVTIADSNITNSKLDKSNIPLSGFGAASANVALGDNQITGVATPTTSDAAATKGYVDQATGVNNTLNQGSVIVGDASNEKAALDAKTSGAILVGDGTTVASVAISGDASLASTGSLTINNSAITNSKLDKSNIPLSGFGAASANVALGDNQITGVATPTTSDAAATKGYVDQATGVNNTLNQGNIIVGDASNEKAALDAKTSGAILVGDGTTVASVAISGDASLASTGSLTINNSAITNSKLDKSNIPLSGFGAASANVALGDNQITGVATPTTADAAATKGYVDQATGVNNTLNQGSVIVGDASNEKAALDAKTSGAILVGDGTTVASVAISGDASLASTGSLTISTGAVTSAKILDGTIATSDIAASAITSVTIADSNITNSKLDKSNIPLSGFGAASANVALGDNQITGVATPTTSDAAATKGYVDSQNATDNTLNQGSVIVGDASNEKAALDAKTSGAILVGDGTTVASVAISGDASLASTGSLTISTGAVTSAKILDGTIATSDIAASAITSVTIADSNITNSKLDKSNIPLSGFGAASANVALGDNQITGVGDSYNF